MYWFKTFLQGEKAAVGMVTKLGLTRFDLLIKAATEINIRGGLLFLDHHFQQLTMYTWLSSQLKYRTHSDHFSFKGKGEKAGKIMAMAKGRGRVQVFNFTTTEYSTGFC